MITELIHEREEIKSLHVKIQRFTDRRKKPKVEVDFCCFEMKANFNKIQIDYCQTPSLWAADPKEDTHLFALYGDKFQVMILSAFGYERIKYCLFCGRKIEYEEVTNE